MPNVIKIPQMGDPEWDKPIPDWRIDEILEGSFFADQSYVKGLARLVKNYRKQLGIAVVSSKGCGCDAREELSKAKHYISTACYHDKHAECRKTCKFCYVACKCPCHT
jgi:hypothetical protein